MRVWVASALSIHLPERGVRQRSGGAPGPSMLSAIWPCNLCGAHFPKKVCWISSPECSEVRISSHFEIGLGRGLTPLRVLAFHRILSEILKFSRESELPQQPLVVPS